MTTISKIAESNRRKVDEFGKNLEAAMARAKISPRVLSDRSACSYDGIIKLLRPDNKNPPSLRTVEKLATALGTGICNLIEGRP